MSNEIINRDSVRMAQAVANHDTAGFQQIAQDIWKQHQGDLNDQNGYWNGVREGANHILRDGFAAKTSAVGDALRSVLPGTAPGSSGFADAEIKFDGSIVFHKSGIDETIHPNETAERQQKGQR